LINNASVFENDSLENFSEKSFTKHININLKAPAILIQNFNKVMKGKEGCIVNIIDQRIEKLTPFFFSYTLSKSSLAVLAAFAKSCDEGAPASPFLRIFPPRFLFA